MLLDLLGLCRSWGSHIGRDPGTSLWAPAAPPCGPVSKALTLSSVGSVPSPPGSTCSHPPNFKERDQGTLPPHPAWSLLCTPPGAQALPRPCFLKINPRRGALSVHSRHLRETQLLLGLAISLLRNNKTVRRSGRYSTVAHLATLWGPDRASLQIRKGSRGPSCCPEPTRGQRAPACSGGLRAHSSSRGRRQVLALQGHLWVPVLKPHTLRPGLHHHPCQLKTLEPLGCL